MPKTTEEILAESTRVAKKAAGIIGGTFEQGTASGGGGFTPGDPKATDPNAVLNNPRIQTDYQTQANEYYGGLNTAPPDRSDIYEQELKYREGQIAGIEQTAARKLQEEQQAGIQRLGQVRALASRGGRLGTTPMAGTQTQMTRDYNKGQEAQIDEWKQNQIAQIYDNVNRRADEKYEAQRLEAKGNWKEKLDFLEGVKDEAIEDVKTMAKSGVEWEAFEQSDIYDQLTEETGKSGLHLWGLWEENKPDEEKISYQSESFAKDGNQWVRYMGFDQKTGELKKYEFDMGVPYEVGASEPLMVGGVPYKVKYNEDGSISEIEKLKGYEEPADKDGGSGSKDEPMSVNQIEQFRRSYDWTPPAGYTWNQLIQYQKDNPDKTPEELEAGAKQFSEETGEEETEETTEEIKTTPEETITSIINTISDEQLKSLKEKADEADISSMWKGKETDVENYLNSIKDTLQTAIDRGYSLEEIIEILIK